MVFYQPPKRRSTSTANERKGLADLPDELLLRIFESLPTQAVLNVRATCSDLTPAATTEVQSRLPRLYIHGSTASLRRAVEICKHPVLREKISEVVLLTYSHWAGHGDSFRNRLTKRAIMREAGLRSWPLRLPPPAARLRTNDENDEASDVSTVTVGYKALLEAMWSLPNLTTLTLTYHCDQSGFNTIPTKQIISHGRHAWEACGPESRTIPFKGWTDQQMVLAILQGYKFTQLRCRTPVCTIFDAGGRDRYVESFPTTELKRLELHVPWIHPRDEMTMPCGIVASQTMPLLEEVRAYLLPQGFEAANLHMGFLRIDGPSPFYTMARNLKVLELISLSMSETPMRRGRPKTIRVDAVKFFELCPQLRRFVSKNILYTSGTENTLEGFIILLRYFQTRSPRLDSLELKLNRYMHDPSCNKCIEINFNNPVASIATCRRLCGVYDATVPIITVKEFDELAARMDVKCVSGIWDFSAAASYPST